LLVIGIVLPIFVHLAYLEGGIAMAIIGVMLIVISQILYSELMNKFRTIFGFIILVLGVAAAYGTFLLQIRLDYWKTLSYSGSDLYYVGLDMWVLVPIL